MLFLRKYPRYSPFYLHPGNRQARKEQTMSRRQALDIGVPDERVTSIVATQSSARQVLGFDESDEKFLCFQLVLHSEPDATQMVPGNVVVIIFIRDFVQTGVNGAESVGTCNRCSLCLAPSLTLCLTLF